jgi:WD40 repeat protein
MFKKLKLLFIALTTILVACDQSPSPKKTISLAKNGVFSATLSENYALLGTMEGYGELWKTKGKPSLIHKWKHTENDSGIISTDISPNEEFAITAEKNSIAWWQIENGTLLSVWSLPDIHDIKISPDGQFALIGLSDKAIYLYLQSGKTQYAFIHDDRVSTIDISSNGKYAITGSDDQTVKLWDLSTGEIKYTWKHQNKLSTVAISHDNKYVFTNGALSQSQLWKISNGKLHKKIGPKLITYSTAEFSNNDKFLLLGHTSQRIELWKVRSGKQKQYWRPKKEENWRPTAATILSLDFSEDNKKFSSIATNGFLQKWRIKP